MMTVAEGLGACQVSFGRDLLHESFSGRNVLHSRFSAAHIEITNVSINGGINTIQSLKTTIDVLCLGPDPHLLVETGLRIIVFCLVQFSALSYAHIMLSVAMSLRFSNAQVSSLALDQRQFSKAMLCLGLIKHSSLSRAVHHAKAQLY